MAATANAAKASAEKKNDASLESPKSFLDRANDLRKTHNYESALTPSLLRELEPLLYEPIPAKYIETTPPTKGKPYESTGVKSLQVQVDRMNEVLGVNHWRFLTHYEDNGMICKAVVVIGNNLSALELDDRGKLVSAGALWNTEALPQVLGIAEGWGGHKQGSHRGDVMKGSETNAVKRALARLGPAAHVYRQEFDLDNWALGEEYKPEKQQSKSEEEDSATILEQLLNQKDELQELRVKADKGMELLGQTEKRRLVSLRACPDRRALEGLIDRVNKALDQSAQDDVSDVSDDQT